MHTRSTVKRILGFVLGLLIGSALFEMAVPTVHAQNHPAGVFGVFHAPAANTQATKTAAAKAGFRHIADCLSVTFVAGATAPVAVSVAVNLRDGASGAGTVLLSFNMAVPATAGAVNPPVTLCPTGGLGIAGTVNTAMTLEFAAAGGANTVESVYLKYHEER
jgi:hypothetical protein